MNVTLRFFQFLSLGSWLGGIFFLIVFTSGIFSALPTRDLAGSMVGYFLGRLHVFGIVVGCIYLLATVIHERSVGGLASPAPVLVFVMIICTIVSQYVVIARMDTLRAQMGSIEAAPASSPLLAAFNRLHQYSVWLEMAVLLCGLAALFVTVRETGS